MFSFDSFSGEWIILKQLDILVIAQALGQGWLHIGQDRFLVV